MAGDLDDQRLSVACTACERAIRLTPEQLRTAFGVMCPGCGRDLTGRAQAVLREFDRAQAPRRTHKIAGS
jgi:predicted RNA-binding Zn-ribbon protein involved in translation (DUF1610 family)